MIGKCVRLFWCMLAAVAVSAVCLFMIPMTESLTAPQFALAGIFWASVVAEMVFLVSAGNLRRRIEKNSPHMKQQRGFGKLGIFCFAQNKEAKIVDGLLAAAIVYLVVIGMLHVDSLELVSLGIAGVYLLFHLHCILNGILYKSIKHYQMLIQKRREAK